MAQLIGRGMLALLLLTSAAAGLSIMYGRVIAYSDILTYSQPRLRAAHADEQAWDIFALDAHALTRVRLSAPGYREVPLAWSPDGERLIFASDRPEPELTFDADSYDEFRYRGGGVAWISDLLGRDPQPVTYDSQSAQTPVWSPDGAYYAFLMRDFRRWPDFIRLGDGASGQALANVYLPRDDVQAPVFAWADDDTLRYVLVEGETVGLYRLAVGERAALIAQWDVPALRGAVRDVRFAPTGDTFAIAAFHPRSENGVFIFHETAAAPIRLPVPPDETSLAFSSDGAYVAYISQSQPLALTVAPIDGGAAQTFVSPLTREAVYGLIWAPAEHIVYTVEDRTRRTWCFIHPASGRSACRPAPGFEYIWRP